MLAGAASTAANPGIGLPSTDTGPKEYIVGFFTLPDDRSTYLGEPVTAFDEDLNFFVVTSGTPTVFEVRVQLDDNVRYLEQTTVDWTLYLTPNDSLYGDAGMYGVKITKINLAWDTTLGSTAVRVSLIDSGINKNHEDAGGSRILAGWDYINNDSNPEDTNGCSYHGSHTAGTAGASTNNGKGIAGVAQASINPLKIFKPGFFGCSTTTTAIVNALKGTGDKGDHVSSNSWGGGSFSTAINDAITYSANKGVTFVAAAGNSGSCTNCVGQPWKGATAPVIVVSCSTSTDTFCSFSSQGPQVDVIAPGSSILSISGGTTTGYKKLSGTSMSAPHVAGVAALVKAVHPAYGTTEITNAIKSSADNLGMISDRQGAGRLDGQGAVV